MDALRIEMRQEIRQESQDVRRGIGELRSTMYRGLAWLVGLQVASLIATIGAVAGLYFR